LLTHHHLRLVKGLEMHHELHTEITINAPSDVVWQVLVDLDRYAEWNPFVVEASGRVGVGERLVNRLQPPGGRAMTFRPTVTEVDGGRVLEWLGRLGLPGVFDGRHRFELRATPSGGTTLVHTERFDGLLVRAMRSGLDTNTKAGFEAMNAALKTRAEAQAGGTA
jgi:hypothetical protein